MKLPTLKKHKAEAIDPMVTPPERPHAKAHEHHGATACEVCGTIGSEPVCEVDGHRRSGA